MTVNMLKSDLKNENKVVSVLLPSSLTESFEIVLARIVDLNKSRIKIDILCCNGFVSGCTANPFKIKGICSHCIKVRDSSLSKFSLNHANKVILDEIKLGPNQGLISANSIQEIIAGNQSTILTFYRRKTANPRGVNVRDYVFNEIIKNYNSHSEFIYNSIKYYIKDNCGTIIEFFNGRIVPTRAAMAACIDEKINYNGIEVWGFDKKLVLASNNSFHDLNFHRDRIKKYFGSGNIDFDLGVKFFEKRRNKELTNARSFTNGQRSGLIKSNNAKPILAIFTSSPDEQKLRTDQWFNELNSNPSKTIQQVTKKFLGKYRIIIRMHPNQSGDKTGETELFIRHFSKHKDVELIRPNDCHSTYELLDIASIILTFGTSVGLEATFWGKPSILCGYAIWDQLDIQYNPTSIDELLDLLSSDLKPKSKTKAAKVGSYYMASDTAPSSLSYRPNEDGCYFVDGKNFLNQKRKSFYYIISRLTDKLLRKV